MRVMSNIGWCAESFVIRRQVFQSQIFETDYMTKSTPSNRMAISALFRTMTSKPAGLQRKALGLGVPARSVRSPARPHHARLSEYAAARNPPIRSGTHPRDVTPLDVNSASCRIGRSGLKNHRQVVFGAQEPLCLEIFPHATPQMNWTTGPRMTTSRPTSTIPDPRCPSS